MSGFSGDGKWTGYQGEWFSVDREWQMANKTDKNNTLIMTHTLGRGSCWRKLVLRLRRLLRHHRLRLLLRHFHFLLHRWWRRWWMMVHMLC